MNMKHRRWIMLVAAIFVVALFLLPGGITKAEAAGPLTVDWRNGEECWVTAVACGTPMSLIDNHFAGYYSISSPNYVEFSSVEVALPEGFYYMDGSTSKQADNICDAVYPYTGVAPNDRYYGGYNDTEEIMMPYLPDAKAGDVYYLTITYTGRVYPTYPDYYYSNYYYDFTQTVEVPILKVLDAWDAVAVTDDRLGTVTLKWDDTMITNDYSQQAAEFCAILSQLAYSGEVTQTGYDYGQIMDVLEKLGCQNIQAINVADNFDKNNMGKYLAEKWIEKDGKLTKIILAIGRGTDTLLEWEGNLNVGSEAVHAGFRAAANSLYSYASGRYYYDMRIGLPMDCFIFFTGHSKAAAAANLAAHWANEKGLNCVAYTFATPTVDKGIDTTASGEKGIYNWVYYQDMIRNAPTMYRYGRYGSTKIFGFDTPSEGYLGMNGEDSYWMDSCGRIHRVRNGFTMQEYINSILYTADMDDISSSVVVAIGLVRSLDIKTESAEISHLMPIYYEAVKKGWPACDVDEMNSRTFDAYTELCKSFLDLPLPRVIRHVFYCPVNVYIYDSDGELVGFIIADRCWQNDDNLILNTLLDSKVVMYSEDMEGQYTFKVEGYADGTVTHSTTYYSMDGTNEMLVSQSVPVANGQTLTFATDPHGDSGYTTYTDEAEIEEVVYDLLGVEPEADMPFTDVQPGAWYYDYVDYVYQNGLMNGVSDTSFAPDGNMTRSMLATVIYRAAGSHDLPDEMPFTDVPADSWYNDAVNWAYINKIVNGTSSTTFSPDAQITREQIVTMFYRYAQNWQCDTGIRADLSGYNDAGTINDYAKDAFRWAVEAGIINGTTDTTLSPKDNATRAQCAAIMQRFNQYIGQ